VLADSAAALAAGRKWARARWRAFRAHPSWSHLMQARVAWWHYSRMSRTQRAFVGWCHRKDRQERRIARIVAVLVALQRFRDRVLRGR
jgi:hypothetical protein